MNINNNFYHFNSRSLYLRLFVIAAGIIVLNLFARWFEIHIPQIETWIKNLGALAPLAFILLFVSATPFFLSVDALCLAAGVLFPLMAGSFYIMISTYLAATVIFVLGRYFFQDRVKVLLTKHPKLEGLDVLLGDNANAFKVMFLLRLLPLPFAALSYAFSITQVKFKPYIISTSGILIYNLTLVYFGFTAKHIASLASSAQSPDPMNSPLLIIGLIIVLCIVAMIIKMARQMIAEIAPEIVKLKHSKN